MADYESIVCVKPEVFVYRIPPRPSNRGYRAADWKLDAPDYTGRMRIVAKGKNCVIKIEDKNSGELFAQAPVDAYPGVAVESVTDSSRYFVIRVQDDSGRSAFIGMGFGDRGDSFDFNVALQDHFKWVRKSEQIEKEGTTDTGPKLDLGFKEGQTITINIGKKKSGSKAKPSGGAGGFLPPPPGELHPHPNSHSQLQIWIPSHRQVTHHRAGQTGETSLELGLVTVTSQDQAGCSSDGNT
ncbi:Adaptin ear-binding coat-associated protein 1 [Branchiostoma belcheri]|nr:Adaptin ear-binding coat-associated protein 1 [Branchiostoma belcheri]